MIMVPRPGSRLVTGTVVLAFIFYLCWYTSNTVLFQEPPPASAAATVQPLPSVPSTTPRKTTIVMAATRNDSTDWVLDELSE